VVRDNELAAFAIVAVAIVLWLTWPRAGRVAPRRRSRRPEGPDHPYRKAAPKPRPGDDGSPTLDDRMAWVAPEDEAIPSRVVELAARTGRRWEAISFLEAELAHQPDPDLAYLLARTLAESDDPAGAERWLLCAARLGQRDVERARADDAFATVRSRPDWPKIEAALAGD
jgi:predicted Zn-dependent protease